MAERPPTNEEIADIRSRIAAYTDENGNGKFFLSIKGLKINDSVYRHFPFA